MQASLTILGAVAFVFYHVVLTLPLAVLVAENIVVPWARARNLDHETPDWIYTVVIFVVMALAVALHAHVTEASVHHHVHRGIHT